MRARKRLTAVTVSKTREPGLHHDGGGLYLQVSIGAGGVVNRSWILRYMLDRRPRKMGLGSAELVPLAEARERALQARKLARVEAVDPIEARLAARQAARAEAARSMTFEECCNRYIAAHQSAWTNARHRKQWPETLTAYAYPVMGTLPVALDRYRDRHAGRSSRCGTQSRKPPRGCVLASRGCSIGQR